jgi:hypothetical protein
MNINDRELLARTLQAEAGNQGYDGMLAAGSVIMNRANATGYGDGMRGVILKPGQFSVWNSRKGPDGNPIYANGEQGRDMANMRASDKAYKAADALMSGTYDDATGGATHYYNPEYSQPEWGQKAGDKWKRIGDHVFGFADAGKKPNPNQAIASDTMNALGSLPDAVGLLGSAQAANNTESKMIPEEKPRGLLGSLGIQRMEKGAEGEDGKRFFQRDSFGDTMAALAPALGRMGVMGLDVPAQAMADRRFKKRNADQKASKTMEALSKMNTPQSKAALEFLVAGGDPKTALKMMFERPKDDSTAAKKNYDAYQKILAEEGPEAAQQFLSMSKSGSTTNINTGGKGANKFEELDAQALADVSKTAMAAGRSLGQIDRLESLLSGVDTGMAASMQSLAGSFGIKTENLGDIQAAEALISALVPQQRTPGSGPMSDADLDLFKKSLPRLINTPGGNAMILQTMRGLAQYDALGGEIVQRYRSKEITQAEAFAQLQARQDPFIQFRSVVGGKQGSGMDRGAATDLLLNGGGSD